MLLMVCCCRAPLWLSMQQRLPTLMSFALGCCVPSELGFVCCAAQQRASFPRGWGFPVSPLLALKTSIFTKGE